MSQTIITLEKALRLWEDTCLITNLIIQVQQGLGTKKTTFKLNGPFVNWARFRDYVCSAGLNLDCQKVYQDFVEKPCKDSPMVLGNFAELPLELCLWIKESKRIYELSPDMQYLLNATSIKNITWRQVKMPFEALAIKLGVPIQGVTYPDKAYDFIMVNIYEIVGLYDVISFKLLPVEIKDYEPIPEQDLQQLAVLLKKKHWQKLLAKIKKVSQRIPSNIIAPQFSLPLTAEVLASKVTNPVTSLIKKVVAQDLSGETIIPQDTVEMSPEGETAVRLAISLSLYLTTRQARNLKQSAYHSPKLKDKKSQHPLTDQSSIFTVETTRKLNIQEQESFSQGLRRQRTHLVESHYRGGTWRFPPNKKDQPGAEKIVWVSPSIVNADLLEKGQTPNGSKVNI